MHYTVINHYTGVSPYMRHSVVNVCMFWVWTMFDNEEAQREQIVELS